MKETLQALFESLRRTSGPTRWVIGASLVLVTGVCGIAVYSSSHPHMELLYPGLDQTQFSAVTSALSSSGVRFDTSAPPAPYSVFVEGGERWRALNAIAMNGALDSGERGINTSSGGSEIFLGTSALAQLTQKRDWEDLEKQLEVFTWVTRASVRSMRSQGRAVGQRTAPPTVSVVVTLRGTIPPSREQRQALASIVRAGAHVPEENISIADQHGTPLFEGGQDKALSAVLDFEQGWADLHTRRAQEFLNRAFGPGMSVVSVSGVWDHDRIESVDEAVEGTKLVLSETTSETKTPIDRMVGGPAGVVAVLDGANSPANESSGEARIAEAPIAETLDEEKRYAYPRKTTHLVQTAPVLVRLSVSLLIDESLSENLAMAQEQVKDLVGFVETRDHMTAEAIALQGIERDADGNPIPAVLEPVPAPPNPLVRMLLERGVEILAAAAFLFVLLRSLKRSKTPTAVPGSGSPVEGSGTEDGEEVDLGLLARRRIDQLIEDEPEKVGVLLSRWAADELEPEAVLR